MLNRRLNDRFDVMPDLPQDALTQFQTTHAEGCRTIAKTEFTPESIQIGIEVERHRWHWKPNQPRILLVAESHVLTTDEDFNVRVREASIRPYLRPQATLPPDHFVRLVYCLAYGETDLLAAPPAQFSNPGTPSYWDIFGRVAFRCPQPRQQDGATFDDRMRWKVDTLRELYRMGIWLLDASAHAIYRRNDVRLSEAVQQTLHEEWWNGYGKFLIDSCESAKVWVIGKTVYKCLTNAGLNVYGGPRWVYQPNAQNVDLNQNWSELLKDCWELRPD